MLLPFTFKREADRFALPVVDKPEMRTDKL
jgi:hypothetical protein